MSNPLEHKIHRRGFLFGAFGVVSGVVASSLPGSAFAKVLKHTVLTSKPPQIGFWDGNRVVGADRIARAERTLEDVSLTIQGLGGIGDIRAIDVNYTVQGQKGPEVVAVKAWTASGSNLRARLRVDVSQGLSLTVYHGEKMEATTVFLGGTTSRPLKVGAYVVAQNEADLSQVTLDLSNPKLPKVTSRNESLLDPFVLMQIDLIEQSI